MQRLLPKAIYDASAISSRSLDSLYIDLPSVITVSLVCILCFTFLFFATKYLQVFLNGSIQKFLVVDKILEKGFTLIELLVVITIIAILAVMSFAVFSGLSGRGNDSRRVADIKAIADAYEVKRPTNASNYASLALAGTDFSGGAIPVDPVSGRNYCIRTGSAVISNAIVSATDGITAAGACVGANWTVPSSTPLVAGTTNFKICVLLSDNTTIRCAGNKL